MFVGYMFTAALSGFTMMAYIANSSYVLQELKGVEPMPFALFFAFTALAQVLLSVVNARIVGRFQPRGLIGFGLILASVAVAALTVGVFAFDTPLLLTCAGFLVLMAVQAFIFGNASALAAGEARHVAGAAFAVIGVVLAVAMATFAPLASSGGSTTAVPMIWVMIVGVAGSLFAYLVVARPSIDLNALSCVFPADPELLPSAADARAREHGITKAKSSLATELHRLREIGATADGAVSDADPMTAIRKALAQRRFDEIILSTLPPGVSRWLARDLPRRVRRRTGVPLTVITAPSGEAERA